jgi:hypothetical protein
MKRPTEMSDIAETARDRDIGLEDFAAELTGAVYPLVLRRQPKNSCVDVELGLWRALAETVKRWARQLPAAASADELETLRERLLVDLTESAVHVALKNGIKGPRLEYLIAPLLFSTLWKYSLEPHDQQPLDVGLLGRAHAGLDSSRPQRKRPRLA